MEDQIKKLLEQLFTTEDLRAVQSLAVELQCAVYGYIEQRQKKLAEATFVQSGEKSFLEIGLTNPSFDGLHSNQEAKKFRQKTRQMFDVNFPAGWDGSILK